MKSSLKVNLASFTLLSIFISGYLIGDLLRGKEAYLAITGRKPAAP